MAETPKRGRGRPPVAEPRGAGFTVRLSERERDLIERAAAQAHQGVCEFTRDATTKYAEWILRELRKR